MSYTSRTILHAVAGLIQNHDEFERSIYTRIAEKNPAQKSLFWRSTVCAAQRHFISPPVFRPRGSRSSSLSVIIISDRPSYTVVDCRRPSFSGRRCTCLERTITSRLHYPCEFSAVIWKLIFSAVPFPNCCSVCEVFIFISSRRAAQNKISQVSLSDTNRFCYFLTYLLDKKYSDSC